MLDTEEYDIQGKCSLSRVLQCSLKALANRDNSVRPKGIIVNFVIVTV